MKLKTHTLGCKVNQYETEFVREGLLGIGYRDAAECRARRSVHRQHLHGHGRRRLQEPAGDSPAGARESRREDRRDGLLRHAGAGGSRGAAERDRGGDRQARAARPAGPLRRDGRAHRHQRLRPPASGLREGAGRLHAAVQLLHHPPCAAAPCQPADVAHPRRSAPARRQRLPRGRAHRHPPGPLRRRVEPRRARSGDWTRLLAPGASHRRSCPATSACGFPASKRPRSRAS